MKPETTASARGPGAVSYVFVASMTGWIAWFAIGFGRVVPEFADLFAGFGADLPRLTQFVLSMRIPIWALLILSSLVQLGLLILLLSTRTLAARRLNLISLGFNSAAQLILIVAMYAPIFMMGAVV